MTIEWQHHTDALDWDELSALYRAAPLGDKPPEWLRTVFGNSRHVCLAREDGRLVGAGRVVADGADFAYLCDIAVMPSHQGSGLGQAIVRQLLEPVKHHRKILLYAVPGKEPFYKRFGFRRMCTAMAIFADPVQAAARGYIDEA